MSDFLLFALQSVYKPAFAESSFLLKNIIPFRNESSSEPRLSSREEKPRQPLTPRSSLTPHPQTHDPWHRWEWPRGCSIFPHGKEISSSPSPGDTKKAQAGSSALPQHQSPALRSSPLPFPTLPSPAQRQAEGSEEPKPGC